MESKILFILFGMSVVTLVPRILPIVVLSKFNLPPLVQKWLRYIPVAVLSALLAPAILLPEGNTFLSLTGKPLLASIPCILIAIKTKNLFLTVSTGILTMLLLQQLLP